MSQKKKYFLNINSLLLFFIFFIISFYLSSDLIKSIFISLFSLIIYLIISNSLVDELLKIEENLQEKIQKSMHELNTPVSTIQINASMLKTKLKDEKNISRLKRIEQASNELLKLYEDMEYFIKEKIDKVDIKEFSLKEAVTESMKKFEDIKKDVKITLNLDNLIIKCDKIGFIRTLDNLIQNALKHNPNLTKIEIFTKEKTLYIKDDGQGIDSDVICNIFNKYFQDHKAKGFGLGLSIVKEYCDKYGIDIKIDTSPKGTTFKLNLKRITV